MGNIGQLLGIIPEYDIVVTFTSSFVSGYHFPHYIDDLIKSYVILAAEQGYHTTEKTESPLTLILTSSILILYLITFKKRRNK